MTSRLSLAFGLSIVLSLPSFAQTAPDVPEYAHFTLDNGLQLVVVPDRRAPIVSHMVWYKVGSADEVAGKTGIAHFLEHLMFKGTEKHPAGEMDATVAELGGEQNAFTSNDVTVYFQTVPPDALGQMMDFEADRMRGLVLTDEMVASERDVVLEERRGRVESTPQGILGEATTAAMFQSHPYRMPVIGWESEIEKLNREDALEFYHQYYAPNNAIVVVSGDVDVEAVKAMAEASYGKVARGADLPERVRPAEPPRRVEATLSLSDPRVGLPSFSTQWLTPTYRTAEPGEAEALDVLSDILSGGTLSRFYQNIVKPGIAAMAQAGYDSGSYDNNAFSVYGSPQGENTLEDVQAAIRSEVEKLIAEGVTEQELERAKRRFKRGAILQRDNLGSIGYVVGETLANGRTIEDILNQPARIDAVTAEDVQAVAAKYLDFNRGLTAILRPQAQTAESAK
jgi:zinc protease